jgi:hypothetical protein
MFHSLAVVLNPETFNDPFGEWGRVTTRYMGCYPLRIHR